MEILGIDVGGSGIKGAPVDVNSGELLTPRHRISTPQPATVKAVANTVAALADHFQWKGAIGCGFPAVVQHGVVKTASNIDKGWIGTNAQELFAEKTGCPVQIHNDADVAGIAEVRFGAGKDRKGVVLVLTIGTGIGSGLFHNGVLVPNSEFGHIQLKKYGLAEKYVSDATRKKDDLSWKQWAERFNVYLAEIEKLLSPDLIILGGGGSKKFAKYDEHLETKAEIVPAELLNEAGIIGAAGAAAPSVVSV